MQRLVISMARTTPLHLLSDGMVKSCVSTIEDHLRRWYERPPIFLLACETSTLDARQHGVLDVGAALRRRVAASAAMVPATGRGVVTGRCTQARVIPVSSAASHDIKHVMNTGDSGSVWVEAEKAAASGRFPWP
jgi:hypothetical protein